MLNSRKENIIFIRMKKKTQSKEGVLVDKELYLYRALYFKEKQKLQNILNELNKYSYLLPDAYRSIIKEILKSEGIRYHE